MNCLACGKELKNSADETCQWHGNCIRKFFGTKCLPVLEINKSALEKLAAETTGKGITVPGVQKKMSLHLFSKDKNPRLTLVNYPTGYILKPQVDEFSNLPEAEHLVMGMAEICGIKTVPHALLNAENEYAYITKRVDRIFDKGTVKRLAMEDFCQLDLRLTQDKYKGSYEQCAKIIEKYSSQSNLDLSELFIRLVFCYIVGNSDMHLKNFSLIETEERSGKYVLSPAYDLLPVNLIMPEDKEEFALTMNGKKRNLRRKDFLVFAGSIGIAKGAAEKMMDKTLSKAPVLLEKCRRSFLPQEMKEGFGSLIINRCGNISAQRKN